MQGPGWHHSGRGTLPPLDLANSETQLSFTAKAKWDSLIYGTQKCANTHRTPSLWTGRARTPCVSWGRRPSADPAGRQAGELVRGREDKIYRYSIQHLLWSACKQRVCLEQLKTAKTTGNIRHWDHRVTILTGHLWESFDWACFQQNRVRQDQSCSFEEKVGGAMERTQLRL